MRFVVAVPARLESARLPGKVMADIGGKPMLQRVLERCCQARCAATVVLCTDSQELIASATAWGVTAVATSSACTSGSERIASVAQHLLTISASTASETVIINVQGDQPFIDPAVIDALAGEFAQRQPRPLVMTPIYRLGADKVHNPDVVKTLVAADGRALYFSRSALPHVRGVDPCDWHAQAPYWGHVGIYGYRADVLLRWSELPRSPLEITEKLEQLRLLEAGSGLDTFVVEGDALSVDTPQQLQQARQLAAQLESG